jgi:gliding motility-associated-like protein
MTKTNYIRVLPPFPRITGTLNTCDGNRGVVKFSQESRKVNTWKWDFGDGTSRILNVDSLDVYHNYRASGTYKVVLTGTNGQCSLSDSTVVYVLLKQNPLLTASATSVCTNSQVQVKITNLQNNPSVSPQYNYFYYLEKTEYNDLNPYQGSVYGQNYDWGNTYNGTLQTFEKGKTGIRMMIRSYNFGCADTTNFIPLSVKGSAAGFQVLTDNVCFKSAVVLKDTSKTNSKITSWQWSFGDGNYQTLDHSATVSHVYANPGSYSVSLQVTDTSGCYTSSNAQNGYVSVNGPKAIFNPSSTNTFITLPIYFYNYTNNYNSYNTTYAWSFGDGSTSTDYSPTHDYPVPGQYTVRLIAKNPATNCTDTMSQVIVVNNFNPAFAYSSAFLTASNCPPVLVRLCNNSINYTSVKWDFGDGITADNINYPAHVYEKPGKYIITLYVYGPGGLTGTYLDSITIQQPTASLQVDKKLGCIGLVSTIKGTIKSATSFTWDFGDGTLLSNKDTMVSHQYNIPGIYQPSLVMIDTNGCNSFSSLNESITIRKNPPITITPATPLICRGQSVLLTASGGISYAWSPSKGLSNTTIAAPNASPDSSTVYWVNIKDDIGCSNTDSILVTVVQKQRVKVSVDTAICMGETTRLIASGASIYNWINNTTGLSNTNIANPVASPVVNTTFTVTGSDTYKCFSDTARITVLVLPLPTVSIAPVQDILLGSPASLLSNYSSDVIQWTWSPSDYLSCINCPAPLSTPLAAITYKLVVKNNVGCNATAEVMLKLQCQESRVFIPSAFSPNNDGNNDLFSIKGISIVKHIIIFNRWGKTVYERSNYIASIPNNGWDGTYHGDLMPAGAYTYFAEMECPSGGSFVRKGTVMLIR